MKRIRYVEVVDYSTNYLWLLGVEYHVQIDEDPCFLVK